MRYSIALTQLTQLHKQNFYPGNSLKPFVNACPFELLHRITGCTRECRLLLGQPALNSSTKTGQLKAVASIIYRKKDLHFCMAPVPAAFIIHFKIIIVSPVVVCVPDVFPGFNQAIGHWALCY